MQKIVKYVRFFVHPSTTTKIPVFLSLSPTISFRTVFFVPFVHNSSFYSSFSFDTLTKLPTKGGAGFPSFLRILSKLNYFFFLFQFRFDAFCFPSFLLCSFAFARFASSYKILYMCHFVHLLENFTTVTTAVEYLTMMETYSTLNTFFSASAVKRCACNLANDSSIKSKYTYIDQHRLKRNRIRI